MVKTTKVCRKCKIEKDISEFRKDSVGKDGFHPRCKECVNKYFREYYHKNRDKYKNYGGRSKIETRERRLRRNFNLSLSDYDRMFEEQNGVCAICGEPEIRENKFGVVKALSIDHNHKTEKIRGLLCSNCNTGLGKFGDGDIDLLCSAISYMRNNE